MQETTPYEWSRIVSTSHESTQVCRHVLRTSLRSWREWVRARENFCGKAANPLASLAREGIFASGIQLDSSPFFSRAARLFALAFGTKVRAGTHPRRLRRLFKNEKRSCIIISRVVRVESLSTSRESTQVCSHVLRTRNVHVSLFHGS